LGFLGAAHMAMADERGRLVGVLGGTLFTAAGLTDVAFSHTTQALSRVGGLVRRSDLLDVARDGHLDVKRRGSLLVRRWTAPPDQHLEALARRVERAARADDA
jgi:hypothetical protein